jgi:hypothetical protein
MARRPVKKASSGVKKAAAKLKTTARKVTKKVTPRSSRTSAPKPKKRTGDVLGLGSARPPKDTLRPARTGGGRPKGIEVRKSRRSTGIDELNQARVRG